MTDNSAVDDRRARRNRRKHCRLRRRGRRRKQWERHATRAAKCAGDHCRRRTRGRSGPRVRDNHHLRAGQQHELPDDRPHPGRYGSTGLRLQSSVLSGTLALPQLRDSSGNPVVECAQFADGFSWGPVKTADLKIAGEQASSLSVQIIGDPAYTSIPSSCSSSGPPENSVGDVLREWIARRRPLPAGLRRRMRRARKPRDLLCLPGIRLPADDAPRRSAIAEPGGMFATDNNGVVIELPAIAASGAATATGSLIFGIGTQSNNGMAGATVLDVDPNTGYITTVFGGAAYASSYIDSGSSAVFFGTTHTRSATARRGVLLSRDNAKSDGNAEGDQQGDGSDQLQRGQRRSAVRRQSDVHGVR